jgi:hypothetical protein
MIVAPMLMSDSSITRVLSFTAPPGSPCASRQAARPTTHSWSCSRILGDFTPLVERISIDEAFAKAALLTWRLARSMAPSK